MKNSKGMIILLVALAALTLVVVVGLFFFYPKEQPKPTPAATTTITPTTTPTGTPLPDAFDPVEWTRDPKTTALETPAPTTSTNDQGFTVTLPNESAPAVTQPLPPSPGASFPTETKPAPVTTPKVTVKPAPVKPTKTVTKVTEYWIQVGSFKDRYQAENTAKALETQGLKGTLTTATVNGLNVVRVRVGPYTNEAEAGKFLSWLKPVKEFGASYITKTVATRTN